MLMSGALDLTGERLAIPLLLLILATGLWRSRERAMQILVAVIAGAFACAYLTSSALLRSRLTTVSVVTSNPRMLIWKVSLEWLSHHLVLGAGPGEFSYTATQANSLALARRLAEGTFVADAHNIFIQVAVTTGALGLLCFLVFFITVLRRARGPLLAFAIFALAVELLEPVNVAVTPLAFLALGASSSALMTRRIARARVPVVAARTALASLAVAAGALGVIGDHETYTGQTPFNYSAAALGARLLPIWSDSAAVAANVAVFNAFTETSSAGRAATRRWLNLAIYWSTRAEESDPTNPEVWVTLGKDQLLVGDTRSALQDYRQALTVDPYATNALVAIGLLDERSKDWTAAVTRFEDALRTSPHFGQARADLAAALRHTTALRHALGPQSVSKVVSSS
jgi:hypothetical protein